MDHKGSEKTERHRTSVSSSSSVTSTGSGDYSSLPPPQSYRNHTFSHLCPMESLVAFLGRSIELLAHAMREEAAAGNLQCFVEGDYIYVQIG